MYPLMQIQTSCPHLNSKTLWKRWPRCNGHFGGANLLSQFSTEFHTRVETCWFFYFICLEMLIYLHINTERVEWKINLKTHVHQYPCWDYEMSTPNYWDSLVSIPLSLKARGSNLITQNPHKKLDVGAYPMMVKLEMRADDWLLEAQWPAGFTLFPKFQGNERPCLQQRVEGTWEFTKGCPLSSVHLPSHINMYTQKYVHTHTEVDTLTYLEHPTPTLTEYKVLLTPLSVTLWEVTCFSVRISVHLHWGLETLILVHGGSERTDL